MRSSYDRSHRKMNDGRSRPLRIGALCLLLASCLFLVDCRHPMTRGGWSRRWGPMVPHHSFPGDCGVCHLPKGWTVMREDFAFDHEKETGRPLNGAHAQAACLRCHNDRGPVKIYVERGCGGCHVDPHKESLGMVCTDCHNEDIWEPVGMIADHSRTRFPLTSAHAITPCDACHTRAPVGDYRGTPVECQFCHQKDAARAFPNHVINGWVRNCERCHTPENWSTPGFNHDAFPLLGGHSGLNCTQCHAGGRVQGTPNDCFSCHQNDYVNAPNHVANGYSTDCTLCHNIFAWR